ncbi:hypothetical protein AB0F68_27200 [Micromonospora sp. NPDC023966]|uniref:hypothetical protein n=1 Tax=Micromonospora sp. NPDC023966 TaxID=3154699 RepID=UPI0033FF92EA
MGSLSRRAELDALVGEATVDAYDDDEQLSGLFTMIEDNLAVPFTTQVLGVEVTVRGHARLTDTVRHAFVRIRPRANSAAGTASP